MDDADFKQRALARRSWPVVKRGLHDQEDEDLSASTTPAERVAMIWRLTVDAWALAGKPIHALPRAEWPGAIVHRDKK